MPKALTGSEQKFFDNRKLASSRR